MCVSWRSGQGAQGLLIPSTFRRGCTTKEAADSIPNSTAEAFKGSPIETEYKRTEPDTGRISELRQARPRGSFEVSRPRAEPKGDRRRRTFFIHGDADGIRLEDIAEMFRLKGGEKFTVTCGRAATSSWPFCPTRHTSR